MKAGEFLPKRRHVLVRGPVGKPPGDDPRTVTAASCWQRGESFFFFICTSYIATLRSLGPSGLYAESTQGSASWWWRTSYLRTTTTWRRTMVGYFQAAAHCWPLGQKTWLSIRVHGTLADSASRAAELGLRWHTSTSQSRKTCKHESAPAASLGVEGVITLLAAEWG